MVRAFLFIAFREDTMFRKLRCSFCVVLFLVYPIVGGADCVAIPADITAWWTGDQTAEDLIDDNDGTIEGATFVPGMVDDAFSFDRVDDYIAVPDHPSLRATTAFSVEFWVNFDILPSGPLSDSLTICEKDNDFLLYWRADTEKLELSFFDTLADPGYRIGANIDLPDITGEWHHLAITSTNPVGQATAEFHFFLDGVEQANSPNSNPGSVPGGWNTDATGQLYIGRRVQDTSGAVYFDGLIDELSLYTRMLSPAEIVGIHDAGSDGKCKDEALNRIFADGFERGDSSAWEESAP